MTPPPRLTATEAASAPSADLPVALAEGFPSRDRREWQALAATALAKSRGPVEARQVERLLGTPTDDGYTVQALYTAADDADLQPPAAPGTRDFRRGSTTPGRRPGWSVRQRHWTESDLAAAVRDDLANGVGGIWLSLSGTSVSRLPEVLSEIDLTLTSVTLEAFGSGPEAGEALLAALPAGRSFAEGTSLGLDPFGLLAGTGRIGDLDRVLDIAAAAAERGCLAFSMDGTVYHDAGASFGEEIGLVTAGALETLRMLTGAGFTAPDAAGLLEFRISATDDQFATIAKLRAARLVWSRVLDVIGIPQSRGQRQHAVTSWAMLTQRDPWVNLVRNTVAAFAAGVGGADAVTVLPHTSAIEPPDDFARRLARNTQHLLLAEARVGVVTDPVGGSWYVESRTRQLAEAAWAVLQEVEGAGGLRAAVESGLVESRISRTWQLRVDRVDHRREPITGVSEFPDADPLPESTSPGPRRPGGGLPQHRYSEPWEELRDRSDAAARHGHRPVVFLVTLGSVASGASRLSFARNLFAAGGLECVVVPFRPDEPVSFPDGRTVVCLCGSDAAYDDLAVAGGQACRKAGAVFVWLAGRSGTRPESDAAAGIDGYLYAGVDGVDSLRLTLSMLEVD